MALSAAPLRLAPVEDPAALQAAVLRTLIAVARLVARPGGSDSSAVEPVLSALLRVACRGTGRLLVVDGERSLRVLLAQGRAASELPGTVVPCPTEPAGLARLGGPGSLVLPLRVAERLVGAVVLEADPLQAAAPLARTRALLLELLAGQAALLVDHAHAREQRRRLLERLAPELAWPGKLTPRERSVLELLVRGLTNRQIAQTLYVTEPVVKEYVGRLFRKTGVRRRAHLVAVALQRGLVLP